MTVGLLSFVSLLSGLSGLSGLSKRNVLNVNFFTGTTDYAFIDHTRCGVGNWSPFGGGAWLNAGKNFPASLDANGWVNVTGGDNWGGYVTVPDPTIFGGPYMVDWVGNGSVNFGIAQPLGSTATFTIGNGSNGMTAPVNCSVTINSGGGLQMTSTGGASVASFQFTFTSTTTGPQGIDVVPTSTGSGGFFIKNVRFYRVADAADLAAGKIFRSAWKQPIVNLCPSAIRFMNWVGGNNDRNNRWENRTLPTDASWTVGSQWNKSPCYQTDATGNNQMVVAAATPTTGNTQNTPASMVHGEIATFRTPNTGGFQRFGNNLTVSSITNAPNGVVTTSSAHGYSTGDIITHYIGPTVVFGNATFNGTTTVSTINDANIVVGMNALGAGIPANTTVVSINSGANTLVLSNATTLSGSDFAIAFRPMNALHLFPCTITVTGSATYQLNVNTSAMGAFSTNSGCITVSSQFTTLQVGSGNDRTPYPCMYAGGITPYAAFGPTLGASQYTTAWFDKTASGQTDGSGNFILGAWMFQAQQGGNVAHYGDVPIEVCVALINELNAMSPAHTIGMWINIPAWGLSSMDPNYTSASNWATNCLDTILNPSSSVRTAGYSALGYSGATKLNTPNLIVEYSNECWNNDDQSAWLQGRALQRWGYGVYPWVDFQDMQALRSTCMARDVKAALPSLLSNVKIILGMWGTRGMANNTGSTNYAVAFAGNVTVNPVTTGDWYINDTLVTGGGWGRPIDNHDGICLASYFDPYDSYYSTSTGTGCFTDDSAMFNGLNNTGNGGGNYSGAANPTQAITNFVAAVVDAGNVHGGESTTRYGSVLYPQFVTQIQTAGVGKVVLSYEGGTDWPTATGAASPDGTGHTLTAGDSVFSIAVINSSQWAIAQANFFNVVGAISGVFMPSIYIWIQGGSAGPGQTNQRWAYCLPDSYGSGTVEGAALTVNSPVWIAMGNRNVALPS